jgi:cytochrome P450
MESCRRRFGDAFSVRFLGFERPMVMLSDPASIRALYSSQEHGLPPGRTIALLPVLGPSSVLLLEGREHLERRKLMLPPFHGERMRSYEEIVRQVSEAEIASWPEDQQFAIHPRMQAITLEVILRAIFGISDSPRSQHLRERLPLLLGESSSFGLQFRVLLASRMGRGDPLARLQTVLGEIDDLLLAEIAERRADPASQGRSDILSLLLSAHLEDGSTMSDRDLRDQLITLLLAGHETTATALAWSFDLLLRHPSVLARLTREVDEGEDAYLRAVVCETLRLRPVVPLAGRRLQSDLNVGSLSLPAGTDVTPAIWLTHTRPDLYPEPYAFSPERFLDAPAGGPGWIPFGGGVRRCLGATFAEFEMRIALQTILRTRTLYPTTSRAERVVRRNVTFSPRHGTVLRARPRAPRPSRAPALQPALTPSV